MLTVSFFEPPPVKRIGGLDCALRSIEAFLRQAGVRVRCNPRLDELDLGSVPHVVHFHGLWQPHYLRAFRRCRQLGIPYVVSPHGMLESWARSQKAWKKWPWFHLLERRHLAGASRLLTTAEPEARHLAEIFPSEKCVVLPLGLPANRGPDYAHARSALGWKESESVLLFLSRIHPKKGLDLLLKALAQIPPRLLVQTRLVIVGGGDDEHVRAVRSLADSLHDRLPAIDWVGEVWGEGKWPYLQGADLFCLTSHSENFGLAVLEALQVGTPVLTTDQTPWTALPSWGAGFVVPPSASHVTSALEGFFSKCEWTLDRRAALAADVHRRFAWSAIGPTYVSFYESLALGNTRRGRIPEPIVATTHSATHS
jgi:glycosyltransferase involved in cell wall biosynthesis